jgi:aminobenzoyl-glutamate transport protein
VSDRPPAEPEQPPPPPSRATRLLVAVEWLGNLLPHPVTLFALFALGVIVASGIAQAFGVAVRDPENPGEVIAAVSLLDGAGFRRIVTNLVPNFVGFVPLGTVLVALLGVGVAEKSGLLSAAIRSIVLGVPATMVTAALVLAGVLSNTASEMGYVVIVPLGAALFYALGRHPLAGLAAAFAGVSGGYSANLLIGTVDPLLAGITEEAARIIDPAYEVHPAVNWYFMAVSVALVTAIGTWVTSRIVEPKLGRFDESGAEDGALSAIVMEPVSAAERRGLARAGVAALGMVLLFVYFAGPGWLDSAAGWIPGWGVLRDPETGALLNSPFTRGVVAMIFIFFLVPGFVYGRTVGTMKNDRDVIDAMASAMSSMGLYIVLVFFAAQFVAYFEWTRFGAIIAVLGADAITSLRLDNPAVFLPFILMCCLVNLMLGSASAQWAITAPIFVPMLMRVGYSPEVIQAAYRIGDSTTNIITPMMSYFGIIYAFACRYDRKLGIGTLISTMLPYTIAFLLGWTVLFYLWVFVAGLPVGPGAPTTFSGP